MTVRYSTLGILEVQFQKASDNKVLANLLGNVYRCEGLDDYQPMKKWVRQALLDAERNAVE